MVRTAEEIAALQRWVVDALDARLALVEDLAGRADGPVAWLAVQRQARSFRRYAETTSPARQSDTVRGAFAGHVDALRALEERAGRELSAAGPDALADARARLGMRVALIGKGGAGKTVISSTLARTLARRGRKVLAVDLDTNPGLAISLGLPPTDAGLPDEALEAAPNSPYGWQLAAGLSPEDVVERFAAVAPDGVRFLGVGKIGELDTTTGRSTIDTTTGRSTIDKERARRSVSAVLQVLLGFSAPDYDVIADLEAGPTTPFERYHAFSEDVVVVVGPAWRSAMTARRLLPMVGDRRTTIVANRFRDEPDHPGFVPGVRIPFDPDVTQAEREGRSPIDACPDSPAVAAVAKLADLLLEQSGSSH